MSTLRREPEIRSFSASGYEILDDGIARGEVVIQAPASAALADVRTLALNKLRKKLEDGGGPPDNKGGIIV